MPRRSTQPTLKQMQFIVGSMMAGVAGFAVVVLVIEPIEVADGHIAGVLPVAIVVLAAMALAAYVVLRGILLQRLRRECDENLSVEEVAGRATSTMQILSLVGSAMAEGIAFFGLVAVLITGSKILLIAPMVGLFLMGTIFPTQAKTSRFVEQLTDRNPYMHP